MRKKIRETWKGSENPKWNGGQYVDIRGYVFIRKPNHPFVNCRGYVKRANLVMEKHLDRYLKPREIPHHKNGIKNDDRIENLQLASDKIEHAKFHRPKIGNRFKSVLVQH